MIILIVNILFLGVLVYYSIVANKEGQFYLFSPFCYPFIVFTIYYLLPSTLSILIRGNNEVRLHHILYMLGIFSFLSGIFLSKKLVRNGNHDVSGHLGFIESKSIPLLFFFIIGILLLIIYGIWSGVTSGVISGSDIEELRRVSEIGKGYIKKTGLSLLTISCLWLLGNYVNHSYKSLFGLNGILFISVTSFFIFMTVGHKLDTLLPLLILIGLYNKYRRLTSIQMLALGCCLFLLIGALNITRRGDSIGYPGSELMKRFFGVLYAYEANYIPVVNSVYKGRLDIQYGKEYLNSATSLIPRFLYPDKPVSFDYFLKKKLHRTFKGGGLPPTIIGSLFLNFGFPGVAVGMLLIGFIYNYLFGLYMQSTYAKSVILLFIIVYLMNPSQFFGNTIFLLLFASLITIITHIMHQTALSGKEMVSSGLR